MSADNWSICPRCKKQVELEAKIQGEKAELSYGKVPPYEYLTLLQLANKPLKLQETLREDYEIRICPDGLFYVSYFGQCDKCGLKFSYKYKENISF